MILILVTIYSLQGCRVATSTLPKIPITPFFISDLLLFFWRWKISQAFIMRWCRASNGLCYMSLISAVDMLMIEKWLIVWFHGWLNCSFIDSFFHSFIHLLIDWLTLLIITEWCSQPKWSQQWLCLQWWNDCTRNKEEAI